MNTDWRNLLLAGALSLVVLLGWQAFVIDPMMQRQQEEQATITALERATSPNPASDAPADAAQSPGRTADLTAAPEATVPTRVLTRDAALSQNPRAAIASPALSGSLRLTGARFDDLHLRRYRETLAPESPEITLLSPAAGPSSYFAELGWLAPAGFESVGPESAWELTGGGGQLTPESPLTLTLTTADGLRITRTVTVDPDYMFTVSDTVENLGGRTVVLTPYGRILREGKPEHAANWILHEGLIGAFNGALVQTSFDTIEDERTQEESSTGGWLGITDKYWMAALIPPQDAAFSARFSHTESGGRHVYQTDFRMEPRELTPGARTELVQHVFAGAKKVQLVDGYAASLGIQRFDLAIDWGWFFFLTKPFFHALEFFAGITGNFGVAILLLTLVIKLAFFPLANTSYRAMSKMKKLQPEMERIQKLHAEDKMKQQQELMELYKREKLNPLSGCLPILIQIPVFFALYKVLFVTLEMRHAPFFGWIQDLSAPDPTSILNLFGLLPFAVPVYLQFGVWPIVMGVTMWLQTKMNPAPADPVQQRMFALMPWIFMVMMATFPAGLIIYWTWNNILSIAQQYVIMRRMGVPVDVLDNLRLPAFLGGAAAAPAAKPDGDAEKR